MCLSAPATAPISPSPPNATAISPAAAAVGGELARVLEAPRQLDVMFEPEPAQRLLDAVEGPPRAAAAGRGVDDQRQLHGASVSAFRSSAIMHRGGIGGQLGLLAGADAGEHDRGVEPGRGRARQVGVEPSPTTSVLAGAEAVERGLEDLRLGLADDAAVRSVAYSSAATIAPVPGHIPSSVGEGAVATGGDHLRAGEHRLGGVAQLVERELVVAGDDDELRFGLARRCR